MKSAKNNQSDGFSELKKRFYFLIIALFVHRLGSHIPVPGIDAEKLVGLFNRNTVGIWGLFNLFSGGSLSRLTIFALGIMPYISASIVIQLLSSIWPALEQLKKEGQPGRRKLTQYTRYFTVVLATLQAFGMTRFISSHSNLNLNFLYYLIVIMTLVAGTMFLMWLGEQITEHGIGNGISMLIFAGIVSNLPISIVNTMEKVYQGEIHALSLIVLLIILITVIAIIVFIENGQRRIIVNYPKRQQGRKIYAAQTSHLPLKINMAGVIPPIFASSIILFPTTLSQWFISFHNSKWLIVLNSFLSPGQPIYIILFAFTIVFFCFFYTKLVFNPVDTADNLKKSGGFLSGIRPGEQTAAYINKVMKRLTMIGAIYITIVSLMPEFLVLFMRVPFYFGGTSLLIIVVIVMDFITQVQAHLMSLQYENLMKKARFKR